MYTTILISVSFSLVATHFAKKRGNTILEVTVQKVLS